MSDISHDPSLFISQFQYHMLLDIKMFKDLKEIYWLEDILAVTQLRAIL